MNVRFEANRWLKELTNGIEVVTGSLSLRTSPTSGGFAPFGRIAPIYSGSVGMTVDHSL